MSTDGGDGLLDRGGPAAARALLHRLDERCIAALGPIPAERWLAELERLGQSAEGSGD